MCDCDNDRLEFWRVEERMARKDHKCDECGKIIAKGTRHMYYVSKGTYRGFSDFRMCLSCQDDWWKLEDALSVAGYSDDCRCLGELAEAIGQAADDGILKDDDPLVIKWFAEPEDESSELLVPDPAQLALELETASANGAIA